MESQYMCVLVDSESLTYKKMIYRDAAKYLDDGAGTLRNRIYNTREAKHNIKQLKQMYVLVSKTLKYRTALTRVIDASQMLKLERKLNINVALLMTYDMLIGNGRLNCGKCPEKDAILRHKTRLNAELVKYKLKNPQLVETSSQNDPPVRWIRVNVGQLPNDSPLPMFDRLGLTEVKTWSKVREKNWFKDAYIPHLYAIHPSVAISKLPEYENGSVIVQDRASCIPVTIMQPSSTGKYIDACAAPGNKTSQLAAQTQNVTAFERDTRRADTLVKMLTTAHLKDKVDVRVMDFTQSEPEKVEGLVVDPSCSGSGIFRATTVTPERLAKLSEFQYFIMMHALRYDAQKVVYSTCSIHAEENEQVVKRLMDHPDVAAKWRVVPRERALPSWPRRGLTSEFEGAEGCVRVEPREDGGIGFFAACFERIYPQYE